MATALHLEEDEQKCTICFQIHREYRKLSGCLHSFCENCIVTFVSNLKQENKLGTEFECPVCKLPSRAPKDNDVILDWVRTMELKNDYKTKLKVEEESLDNTQLCSQCKHVNKSVMSDTFCLDCREHFCKVCSEMLHAFKVNANHYLINTDEVKTERFHEQALQLFDKFETCSAHPGKSIAFHCHDDDKLLCGLCATEVHRNCRDVTYINDVERQCSETESAKLSDVATKLEKHIQAIISIIKENETENKKTLESLQQDIQGTKQKVIRVLDGMEENLNQTGKAIVKEISIKDLDDLQELDKVISSLKIAHYLVDKIVTKISPEQAYICIHEAKCVIKEAEKKIIGKWSTRKKLGIKLRKENMLESVQDLGINETSQLASIDQTEMEVCLPVYHEEAVLKNISIEKIGVHTIVPKDVDVDKDPQPTYNGLVFLPNDHFLLTDSYNGCCHMVNENMCPIGCYTDCLGSEVSVDNELNYFSNLIYASYAQNGMLAISVPSEKKICLVTADETLTYKGEIACSHTPMALHVLNNADIAVSWDDPVAFGIISGPIWQCEKVYFTMDKSGRQIKYFHYMAIDEKRRRVIQPCNIDKAVYCFEYDGQPVFQYCSEKLRDPKGAAVDGEGNIYVCEAELVSIHILSPTGQVVRIIKEAEGCPERPLAIGFQTNGKTFAVTGYYERWYDVHFFAVVSEVNNITLEAN